MKILLNLLRITAVLAVCTCGISQGYAQQCGGTPTYSNPYPIPCGLKPSDEDKLTNALIKGDRSAIPNLEKLFDTSNITEQKSSIASILLSSGVRDQKYFDYLADQTRRVLQNPIPDPIVYDNDGRVVRGKLADAFILWCKKHGRDPQSFAYEALYGPPKNVVFLAASGDPRGFDLLMEALHSENRIIAFEASKGLAKIQDNRAIQPIIRACEDAPRQFSIFARALVYFNDAAARSAARTCLERAGPVCVTVRTIKSAHDTRCITPEELYDSYLLEAKKMGTKGLFGY